MLRNGDEIRVGFDTERGQVVDFSAQLECLFINRWRPVVRYDSAHGRPHRDTLDWDGYVVDKQWLPEGVSFGDALNFAIDDLRNQAAAYRQEFERRQPR